MKKLALIICIFLYSNFALASFEDPSAYFERYEPKTRQEPRQNESQQKYKAELKERGLPLSISEFIKYIKKGDVEIVKLYLDAGINPNVNFYTDYPIYFSAKEGRYEVTKLLLEYGAKPNIGFDSALFYAIKKRDAKTVQLLLEHGADPNNADFIGGETFLYYALDKKMYEIAKILITCGTKVDNRSMFLIEKKKIRALVEPDNIKQQNDPQ